MPPENEAGRAHLQTPGPTTSSAPTAPSSRCTHATATGSQGICAARRRRQAAARLMPLDCGCADPWTCHCSVRPPLTEPSLSALAAAATHLREMGLLPLVPAEPLRALWRAGWQELAEDLADTQIYEPPPRSPGPHWWPLPTPERTPA